MLFGNKANVIRTDLNVTPQWAYHGCHRQQICGMFMDDFGDRKLKERHDYYDVSDKVAREYFVQQTMRLSRVVSWELGHSSSEQGRYA